MKYLPCLIFLCGCSAFTHTVYVPAGKAVRLRAPAKNAAVWVKDAKNNDLSSRMTIPEGWYCLPAPNVLTDE